MSIFDPKTMKQHVQEFRGDKGLIGFTTQDGKKHVGWYAPIYNPCGDIGDPESVVELYKDIYGKEYKDVKGTFTVSPFCCFYKDHSNDEYCLLKYPIYENEANENPLQLFDESYRKALIEDDEPARHALRQMIREWLLINAQCQSSVYIENDFSVRSDAPILIHPSAKNSIPEYIKIKG